MTWISRIQVPRGLNRETVLFHKAAFKNLVRALRALGYLVTGPNGTRVPEIATRMFEYLERVTPQFDAYQDNPWPVNLCELDERFPGSKFILTIRSPAAWIKSVVNQFGCEETLLRQGIYGVGHPKSNEENYLRRYEEHNRNLLALLRHWPDNLPLVGITAGDSWDTLCPFLGRGLPRIGFPVANTATARHKLP